MEISNCFNWYFVNIIDTLCLNEPDTVDRFIPLNDPILNALKIYSNYPSITRMKNNIKAGETFEFQPVSLLEI